MTAHSENVGMAEIRGGPGPRLYTCLGLGSCIGVCMLDPEANLSLVAHVMLPESFAGRNTEHPGKFADTAIPEMKRLLLEMGGSVEQTTVTYAGGAQVFQFGDGGSDGRFNIGARNIAAVETVLETEGFTVLARDIGGSLSRTILFNSNTGIVQVRAFTRGEVELCNLRARTGKAA